MTPKQKRRLAFAAALVAAGGVAAWAVVGAAEGQCPVFPQSQRRGLAQHRAGTAFRLGGLVEKGSVTRGPPARRCIFSVTDGKGQVPVAFKSACCRRCSARARALVTLGALDSGGTFQATEVLAKHDREIHAAGSGGIAQAQRTLEGRPAVTGELGQLALCFALALSLVMAAGGLAGARADAHAARAWPTARRWACWCSSAWPSPP